MQAMKLHKVWDPEPVHLPPGKRAVGSRMLLRIKRNQDGSVDRFKARLIAQGYNQVKGCDYEETFSSVGKWATVRTLLALACILQWEVEVVDVDTAFLNAPLHEEVYLRMPAGLQDGTARVYRLRKALYGLKQSPRTWEQELGRHLLKQGFQRCQTDSSLYVLYGEHGQALILVYVDDLLIVGENQKVIQEVKKLLSKGFKLKDLGPISTYLGMRVTRDRKHMTLALDMPRYISDLEHRFSTHLNSKSGKGRGYHSPLTPELAKYLLSPDSWTEEESSSVDRQLYMSILGSLMFASLTCRPDLAYSVSLLSQWGVDPRQVHLEALTRVLRYLINTKGAQLVYQGSSSKPLKHTTASDKPATGTQPIVYTDSDWGGDRADGLSRAGWTVKIGGGAVSWYSKKLKLVALSSAEAEYKALAEGAKEAIWFIQLYTELGLKVSAIRLLCDNQAAIAQSKNPVQQHKTRHYRLAWHFVRQVQEAGEVQVDFVKTALQDADLLTKALPSAVHQAASERLGLYFNK